MNISQFEYKDVLIELTHQNGFLAWSFDYNGNAYGTKVKVSSKKVLDIASVTASLLLNAIATYEELTK